MAAVAFNCEVGMERTQVSVLCSSELFIAEILVFLVADQTALSDAPERRAARKKSGFLSSEFMYRIMYELAVCSDGMTEAQPRSFRQNRPASEYII